MTETTSVRDYLGDSVYVGWDGYGLELTTSNGFPDDPRNRIYLEPEVFQALVRFMERVARGASK